MTVSVKEALALYRSLPAAKQSKIRALIAADKAIWRPLPGPQTLAYQSRADIIGYGGSAGGGKTDLMCGKMLTQHRKGMILRRVGTEITGIEDRLEELLGDRNGYNGTKRIWRHTLERRGLPTPLQIEFASLPNLGDERGYQGRPHDFLGFDEAANFLEQQVRFLLGWLRTTIAGQVCQALLCFNPPTSAEGEWIIDFFAPWLDRNFPNPAKPGELRFAAMVPGADGKTKDLWLDRGDEFVLVDGKPNYDFDPVNYAPTGIIRPLSRTFIPSRVSDNPYLTGTGYMATLQALPEPLRSQMLYGDFMAGKKDDAMQVIPTAWVQAAQDRWKKPDVLEVMDSLGVDVARGGDDNTVIARRHGRWYDELLEYPGKSTPDGPITAALVVAALRDQAPIHVDGIGVGASPYDFLRQSNQQAISVIVSEKSNATDISGRLRFLNLRAQLWWQLREDLDPKNNRGIALPPGRELLVELCAPRWSLRGPIIVVESRDEIIKRVGRSVDRASAILLAKLDTPKIAPLRAAAAHKRNTGEYDPFASLS